MNGDIAVLVAPATLFFGSGLFAAGALSFLDIHFFKTKVNETAAIAAGLALIFITELIFVTSSISTRYFNAQRMEVSVCELDAEKALPLERVLHSKAIQERIIECMKDLGYEWTDGQSRCIEAPVATNAYCYLPNQSFARAVTLLQMKFNGGGHGRQ